MIEFSILRRRFQIPKKIAIAGWIGLWFAICAVAGLMAWLGIHAVTQAKTRLIDQAQAYAHLIAEHDRYGFTLADVILLDMIDELTPQDVNGVMTPQRHEQIRQYLIAHRNRLPGIASFTLIGADGIRRVGVVNKDGTDLSGRAYFKALKGGQELYVSQVEDGRASGKPGIHVVRRINGPNGEFAGALEMNLPAQDVFFKFYKSIDLGPHATTSLRDSKRVLIRYPTDINTQIAGQPIHDGLTMRIEEGTDQGYLESIDPNDGLEKVTAYERLPGTTMYATVSLPTDVSMMGAWWLLGAAGFSAIVLLVGGLGVIYALRNRHALKVARDEAERAGAERQRLLQQFDKAVEDERRAIALDIHDVLNATVLSIKLNSQGVSGLLAQASPAFVVDEIRARVETITVCANDMYAHGRSIIKRLRPEELDVLGLDKAIEEMVASYDNHPNCQFSFESMGEAKDIHPGVAIAAYRITQEALSNVVKHARATHAHVSLKISDDELKVTVVDDGNGMRLDQKPTGLGLGLVGMRERAAAWNGTVVMRHGPNSVGVMITATIPLKHAPAPANFAA